MGDELAISEGVARVLPFVRPPLPTYAPAQARVVLGRLIDNLQLIAAERPIALAQLADFAEYWAAPLRRRVHKNRSAAP